MGINTNSKNLDHKRESDVKSPLAPSSKNDLESKIILKQNKKTKFRGGSLFNK